MSHRATCLDDHAHGSPERAKLGVQSVLDPSPTRVAARSMGGALRLPEIRWALIATVLFAAAGALQLIHAPAWWTRLMFGACYTAGGWEPAVAGLRALREKTLDVDLLMIVAAVGAATIGQVLDGGLLIVIFSTSGALEAYATKRTADSVRSLLALAPEQASLLTSDGSEMVVDTAALSIGDVIVVRPGEQIGADGTVVAGISEVDQASITGEPLPVVRTVGDDVFAGTQNREGVLRVEVSRAAADSVVARIVVLVAQASATKAKAQLFIEKVEQRYSVGVVVTTLMVFGIPLAFGSSLQPTLLRAMTYMIVASPCAVVLATMPPLLSAIANAGRHGVLVKSAVVMEQLGATTLVAFDKTGTLTRGTPRVSEVALLGSGECSESEVLALAAGAELPSEHPLSRAVVQAALDRGVDVPDATDFAAHPGRGVSAQVDHRHVVVGAPDVIRQICADQRGAGETIRRFEGQGRTAVIVVVDAVPVAVLALVDHLRPQASRTVQALTRVTGRQPVLLTGDNHLAAGLLGREVGITDVRAGLLPADKAAHVTSLTRDGERVLVVGDGINDAPALAAAHMGVSMGRHGSDLTLQTADAILVSDDLASLPAVIELSRRAHRAVVQNLVLAGVAILGLVSWDLLGRLPLPLGVLGHEGGTVLVGLNGLRLLRARAWAPRELF